jgi:hypothetical protein
MFNKFKTLLRNEMRRPATRDYKIYHQNTALGQFTAFVLLILHILDVLTYVYISDDKCNTMIIQFVLQAPILE